MDANNSFHVKFIATEAPTFFGYIISVLAKVCTEQGYLELENEINFICFYYVSILYPMMSPSIRYSNCIFVNN